MLSHSLAVFQNISIELLSVQFRCSVISDCATPWTAARPGFSVHHPLPELAQTHVHPVSNVIQPSYPLLSPSPPALNLSQHHGLFHESVFFIRWPNYWRFIFSISPSNEYSGLISFRIDWFDLAVQGTLKSLLQHNSSKASRITMLLLLSRFISCPTQCDPIDGSPPGSAVPEILQARTRVGCHFLLQCMKVKSESEVAQSCPTPSNPMDCSPPGSSVHGIFQARVLEWVAIAFSDRIK